MEMRTSTILMTSLLALASPATAQTASARSVGAHQTGSSSSAALPVVDPGLQAYPSSATGADERGNPVIANGAIVTPPTGDGMPESVNSFPPGFTNTYLAHR
jgi:hypothetical protein